MDVACGRGPSIVPARAQRDTLDAMNGASVRRRIRSRFSSHPGGEAHAPGPARSRRIAQALLVAAGQDIHRADPLGDMRVDETGFAQMALRCVRLAKELCDGKLAFVLEGGYDRQATAHAVEAVLRTVLDESAPEVPADAAQGTEKASAAIARAREVQSAYWKL